MLEGIPQWIQIAVLIAGILGVKKLLEMAYQAYLGKDHSAATIAGIHLSNSASALSDVRDAMELMKAMRIEMESDKAVISALKDDKIEDDRKLARRDGVIEEQRRELKELHEQINKMHEQIGEMQAQDKLKDKEIAELKDRVSAIEAHNEGLLKENLQMKGIQNKGEEK
jgi:predicted RNase H-like nuclease (RuvC/YqgF family)